jgi:hypothetical protein
VHWDSWQETLESVGSLQNFCLGSGGLRGILSPMRSQASRAIITLVLITCLVCPLVEMFDHWDHTVQTGNDTEYALVVLALCIGVAYSFARYIFKSPFVRSAAAFVSDLCARKPLPCFSCNSLAVIPFSPSPPALALRI